MDPMDLEHLLFALRRDSVEGPTVDRKAAKLEVGDVLADLPFKMHVIVKPPVQCGEAFVSLRLRHLHGGHTLTLRRPADTRMPIFTRYLHPDQLPLVPEVPPPFLPADPDKGDRVIRYYHQAVTVGTSTIHTFDGAMWCGRSGDYKGIKILLADESGLSMYGWHTYVPAGHRPHLYIDGRPYLARTVTELAGGDIIRLPGGARLRVHTRTFSRGEAHLVVEVVEPSAHTLRHTVGLRPPGTRLDHFDTSTGGDLYPTEARADELLGADGLQDGDTVITCYGMPYSTVAQVTDVETRPSGTAVKVTGDRADGRELDLLTSMASRFVLLHRPPPRERVSRTPR